MAGNEKSGGKLVGLISGLIGIVVLGVVLFLIYKGGDAASGLQAAVIVVSVGLACACLLISQLLGRAPSNVPGTSVSAEELGGLLGGAIDEAFSKHLPQPEKYASAVSDASSALGTKTAEQVEKLNSKLLETQSTLVEALQKAESQAVKQVDEAKSAFASLAGDFKSILGEQSTAMSKQSTEMQAAFSAISSDFKAILSEHSGGLKSAAGAIGDAIANGHATGAQKIEQALAEHADKVQSANQQLAAQLDKITELEQDIQKVLHVQEVVDGTIKSVTATEEFSSMLTALRSHLVESDKLLQQAAKPRKIRLVESGGEVG